MCIRDRARIEVLLRRNRINESPSHYQSSGVVVDMGSRLCCRGDKTLRLPVEEWKMLIDVYKRQVRAGNRNESEERDLSGLEQEGGL